MATSLSVSNFISSFPSKTPAPHKLAPTQIAAAPPSSSPTQFRAQTLKSRVVAGEEHSSSDLSSVICPSLAYSNTLYAKSPYHVQLVVEDDEPEEELVSRFRRDVVRAGIVHEVRRRKFHENKQEKRKRKIRDAARRNRRRRTISKFPETAKAGKNDADEDNWDLPDGEA